MNTTLISLLASLFVIIVFILFSKKRKVESDETVEIPIKSSDYKQEELSRENGIIAQQLKETNETILDLESKYTSTSEEINNLNFYISDLHNQIDTLTKDKEVDINKISSLTEEVATKIAIIKNLETSSKKIKRENDELIYKVDDLNKELIRVISKKEPVNQRVKQENPKKRDFMYDDDAFIDFVDIKDIKFPNDRVLNATIELHQDLEGNEIGLITFGKNDNILFSKKYVIDMKQKINDLIESHYMNIDIRGLYYIVIIMNGRFKLINTSE